jgi:hypothetical protein
MATRDLKMMENGSWLGREEEEEEEDGDPPRPLFEMMLGLSVGDDVSEVGAELHDRLELPRQSVDLR